MFAYNGPSTEALTIDGNWVVHPKHATTPNRKVFFKQNFTIEDIPGKVVLRCCFDDSAEFFLNGVKLQGGKGGFRVLTEIDVTKLLKRGANELSGTLFNHSGQCGVVFELKSDKTITASGGETLFSEDGRENWVEATLLGKPPVKPWMLPNEIETY